MTDKMELRKKYPKDTLGYHYLMSQVLFGKESDASIYLEEKAMRSPNGWDERVIVDETQVVYLLGVLHMKYLDRIGQKGE